MTDASDSLSKAWDMEEATTHAVAAVLHTLEGFSEREVFAAYGIEGEDLGVVLDETGTPAGWHPLVAGYDTPPPLPEGLSVSEDLLSKALCGVTRVTMDNAELGALKARLRAYYEAGPGAKREEVEDTLEVEEREDEEDDKDLLGARIEIPHETFLEELSRKLEIHPISVYWLLEELRKEGARCLPEERHLLRDRMTVLVLRLFGHRWPRDVEAGVPVPEWADRDGIIPLVEGTGEKTLLDLVRERMADAMGERDAHAFEQAFKDVMGTDLGEWLRRAFIEEHAKQFRNRPVVWVLASGATGTGGKSNKGKKKATKGQAGGGGFACMVYYHALDRDLLAKIRTRYLRPIVQRREFELAEARKKAAANDAPARAEAERLEGILDELRGFEAGLQDVEAKGFWAPDLGAAIKREPLDRFAARWEGDPPPPDHEAFVRQEQAYDPDLNDGVRVNIAPLQGANLLAVPVLPAKDVKEAVADRARWRAEERRLCREGKLPRPGWWGHA
jgi:hypothetical protein